MKCKTNKLRDAISFALAVGVTAVAGTGVAYAQEAATQETTTLDRIEVTGSRIKRAEVEGPQPVITLTQEDLRVSGNVSVADVLRDAGANSFGSFQGGSGFGNAQGAQQVSLRGIGAQYTLVLINGRRMSASPALSGDSANVANIPMAAVERIEILRDGASAIYGSDAIGGVINVILKKDFNGLILGGQLSNPSAAGGNDSLFYATMGVSGERGSLMTSYEKYTRDIILAADRPGLTGPSDLTTPEGIEEAAGLGLISPTGFPGRYRVIDPVTGRASGPWHAGPGCPTSFGSSEFPNSALTPAAWFGLSGGGDICAFNYAAVAGSTSAINRDTLTVNGEFQITENTTAFFRAINGRTKSFGRFAPTPSTIAAVVPGDAPYNPIPGSDLAVNIRFVPLGPRDQDVYDYVSDVQFGLNGTNDWFGGADWEVAVGRLRNKMDSFGYNYVIAPLLQIAIEEGLNPFDSDAVAAAASTFAHTITNDDVYNDQFVDARLGWDLFEIGGRPAGFVIGAEHHDVEFKSITDQQSQSGTVVGSAGASARGARTFSAAYFETVLPVLETLEVGLAGRYDTYSDVGNKFTPKVSLSFRPSDSLLLRANWGKGFKAPSLVDLYGSAAQSFNDGRDRIACLDEGTDPFSSDCANVQRENLQVSNSALSPEDSKQWTAGIVWSPNTDFSIALDYYDIEIAGQIRRLTVQEVLDAEYRCEIENIASFCNPVAWGSVDRERLGDILVVRPLANTATVNTSGVDLTVRYGLDTGMGKFKTELNYSHVLDYDREATLGSGLVGIIDSLGIPESRANLRLGWSKGDLGVDVVGNYTDSWANCDAPILPTDTQAQLCDAVPPSRLPSFTTWSVSGTYQAPWNARVTLGVRNIGDRQAVLDYNGAIDPLYSAGLVGRTPYFSYEQRF